MGAMNCVPSHYWAEGEGGNGLRISLLQIEVVEEEELRPIAAVRYSELISL